jgi:hypothetical protein
MEQAFRLLVWGGLIVVAAVATALAFGVLFGS